MNKLLAYEPLEPLTGEPDEWVEVDPGVFQNRRCSRVFKDVECFGGQSYDLHAVVFCRPDGSRYTSNDSRQVITFPYTPTSHYVDVNE